MKILKYADLRGEGASTSALRMKILEDHAVMLEDKIAEDMYHLKKLKEKIKHYSETIELELNT